MRVRNGLLVGREKFELKISHNFNIQDELDRFLVQYYQLTMDIPSEVLLNHIIESKISDKGIEDVIFLKSFCINLIWFVSIKKFLTYY